MAQLTAEQIAVLREKLVAESSVVTKGIRHARPDPRERDGDAADLTAFDRDADLLWELEEQGSDRLFGIEEALQRLDAGTYGICEQCGRHIPLARLLAIPVAKYCVSCQQEAEERHATEGRPPPAGVLRRPRSAASRLAGIVEEIRDQLGNTGFGTAELDTFFEEDSLPSTPSAG